MTALTEDQIDVLKALALYGADGVTSIAVDKRTWGALLKRGLVEIHVCAQVVPKAPGQAPYVFRRDFHRLTKAGLQACHDRRIVIQWEAHNRAYIFQQARTLLRLHAAICGFNRPDAWVDYYRAPHLFSEVTQGVREGYRNTTITSDFLGTLNLVCAIAKDGLHADLTQAFQHLSLLRATVKRVALSDPSRFTTHSGYCAREELGWDHKDLENAPLFQDVQGPVYSEDPADLAKAS